MEVEKNKSFDPWKEKALQRGLVIKFLKQRIKELTLGREDWKKKALERGEQIKCLEQENKALKKSLLLPRG